MWEILNQPNVIFPSILAGGAVVSFVLAGISAWFGRKKLAITCAIMFITSCGGLGFTLAILYVLNNSDKVIGG